MTTADFGLNVLSINGAALSGVGRVGASADYEMMSPASDGQLHETLHSARRVAQAIDFATLNMAQLFTASTGLLVGSTDLPSVALNGTTGAVAVAAKAAADAVGYASGSVHETLTALYGVLWCTGLQWSLGGDLVASLRALLRSSDGATAPTALAAAALPTQPVPTEAWSLYQLLYNGTAVDGVQGVSLGIEAPFRQVFNGTQKYPAWITGPGLNGPVRYRLTWSTTDQVLARTIGLGGATSTVAAQFRKAAQGAVGLSDASTLTITMNARLTMVTRPWDTQQGSPASIELTTLPRLDGSTKPVTIAIA